MMEHPKHVELPTEI